MDKIGNKYLRRNSNTKFVIRCTRRDNYNNVAM